MATPKPPAFLVELFGELRARHFPLGYADLLAVRDAVGAGFGLSSPQDLAALCVALWAKSPSEADVIRTLFQRLEIETWDAGPADGPAAGPEPAATAQPGVGLIAAPLGTMPAPAPRIGGTASVPPLPVESSRRVVLAPQFPLTQRVVAQSFRRLRRPSRYGPATELDVGATVLKRSRSGLATPPVLVPRRRNRARLLLMIDRQGSMAPFEPYLRHLQEAIARYTTLEQVWVAHFHDCPVDRADATALSRLLRGLFPVLDPVLAGIGPDTEGTVFRDPELLDPLRLEDLLDEVTGGVGVVVISDAGALRGGYDVARLVASVAFARALRQRGHVVVWLNPVPQRDWATTSAAELARHVPMFPLDVGGLHGAVEVLRGRPVALERPA